jgi:hypothetical protein
MALTNCSECGKETSDKARTCSNCEAPSPAADLKKSSSKPSSWIAQFVGLAVLIAVGLGLLFAVVLVAWNATTSLLS